MSNCIIAELSSDAYIAALGMTLRSPSPVLAMCRKLVASSTYAPETPMNVYRGKTLCLRVLGIGEAAELEINSKGTGFRRVTTPSSVRPAPPIESDGEAVE
jgi:hypothetical protein